MVHPELHRTSIKVLCTGFVFFNQIELFLPEAIVLASQDCKSSQDFKRRPCHILVAPFT